MDYKNLSTMMNSITDENSITDVLMCIEMKLRDKVDELNEQYEESKLTGKPDDSLRVQPMRYQRLLDDISAAKSTALLIE